MEKRSFLIYKDNAPMIRMLSLEEAGLLLRNLLDYAEKAEQGQQPQEYLAEQELPRAVELVFGFMAANIYRDTNKWLRTRAAKVEKDARRAQSEPRRVEAVDPPRASPFPRTYY